MASYPTDFTTFTQQWVDKNQWPLKNTPTNYSGSVLAMTGASADGFTFHSGAGHIQLKGYYQSGQDPKLVNASIHLMVPSWGEVKLMDKQTIRLVQPTHVPVKVGGIDGKIKIKIANDLSTQVVLLDYDLATPYGSMKDKCGLFPVDATQHLQAQHQALEKLDTFSVSQLQSTPVSHGQLVAGDDDEIHWELSDLGVDRDSAEIDLLVLFMNDFAVNNSSILLPSYPQAVAAARQDANDVHSIDAAASKDKPFAIEQSFLGIFVGQDHVARGSLNSAEGVTAKINVAVASGSAKLFTKDENGKHALYINAQVKVQLVGTKTVPDTRLLLLPYVDEC
ncbi:hypothetical protein RHS01_08102 [Rhizoctonia solani]|uniref:Uncharacterized protein n=1 Tax=Rhizoctonia solani TaxID=456999 RepID=A0A8H7M2E2_9AGAM|nr:hypothetical protein RHS01_08102 [Rhizoctonia solani]